MSVPDFIAMVSAATGIITAIATLSLLDYRMKQVEKKIDIHNGYASRFEEIELAITAIQKDIEYIKNKGD